MTSISISVDDNAFVFDMTSCILSYTNPILYLFLSSKRLDSKTAWDDSLKSFQF